MGSKENGLWSQMVLEWNVSSVTFSLKELVWVELCLLSSPFLPHLYAEALTSKSSEYL